MPVIDEILEAFRLSSTEAKTHHQYWNSPAPGDGDPDAGDSQEYESSSLHRSVTGISQTSTKAKPAVIELTSTGSSQGKTQLLLYLAAISTLPRAYGGKESAVVWFDTALRLCTVRLFKVIQNWLAKSAPGIPTSDHEALSRHALRHVHVFRPQSSSQLIASLESLSNYLLNSGRHFSSNRPLSLLVLDSATSFHWQDRLDADMARIRADPNAAKPANASTKSSRAANIIDCLKTVQQSLDCTILLSTDLVLQARPGAYPTQSEPREAIALTPYSYFAVLTFVLSRIRVPQFNSSMSLEECVRDQPNRLMAVSRGRFNAYLDRSLSESWSAMEKEAISKLPGQGSFGFRVTEEGVEMLRRGWR